MSGKAFCKIYTNVNEDLAVAGVIIHDMEKIREIESNSLGISPGYTFKGELNSSCIVGGIDPPFIFGFWCRYNYATVGDRAGIIDMSIITN